MLPERVAAAFAEIWEAEPYPAVWVATVGLDRAARVRTLILRHLEGLHAYFFCNAGQSKLAEIEADALGEVCLLGGDRPKPFQLRWRCRFSISDEEVRLQQWRAFPGPNQEKLYGCSGPQPPDSFVVMLGEIFEIDMVDFRTQPPQRWGYRQENSKWFEEPRKV